VVPARRKDIRKIANLIGNAAAHVALYPVQYKRISEALVSFGQAEEVAGRRSWNETELERCRQLAYRRAASEIHKRMPAHRLREESEFIAQAQQAIDDFIEQDEIAEDV
jgi:hypothetical protein